MKETESWAKYRKREAAAVRLLRRRMRAWRARNLKVLRETAAEWRRRTL